MTLPGSGAPGKPVETGTSWAGSAVRLSEFYRARGSLGHHRRGHGSPDDLGAGRALKPGAVWPPTCDVGHPAAVLEGGLAAVLATAFTGCVAPMASSASPASLGRGRPPGPPSPGSGPAGRPWPSRSCRRWLGRTPPGGGDFCITISLCGDSPLGPQAWGRRRRHRPRPCPCGRGGRSRARSRPASGARHRSTVPATCLRSSGSTSATSAAW